MENDSSVQLCPVCNEPAKVTEKWVKNKTGKKYVYKIFSHQRTIHRVNGNLSTLARNHKEDVRRELLYLLNSGHFERTIFSVKDVIEALDEKKRKLRYSEVSRTLLKFAEANLISMIRKDRAIFFINAPKRGKLNYLVKEIYINLFDTEGDGRFNLHKSRIKILNFNSYPLTHLQYRAFGDNVRSKALVSIKALDISDKKKLSIYYKEDNPLEKKVIIEFARPIPPGKEKTFSVEYYWPEMEPSYTFTASTELRILKFSLKSKRKLSLTVFRTNPSQTLSEDVSSKVKARDWDDGFNTALFEDKDIQSFVMFKFKWFLVEESLSEKEMYQSKGVS